MIGDHDQRHPVGADDPAKVVKCCAETPRLLKPLDNCVELPQQEQQGTGKQRRRKEAAHASSYPVISRSVTVCTGL